jgi:hypothetical protein
MAVDTLFSTKYPNNQSVVSGTYTVFKDDVTILCDTSTAPVTINLLQIPSNGGYTKQGNWSTQYKLYVVDFNDNSATNNITIVAPTGFKINGQPSIILNSNGGSVIVRIASNLDYIAFSSASGNIISVGDTSTVFLSLIAGNLLAYVDYKDFMAAVLHLSNSSQNYFPITQVYDGAGNILSSYFSDLTYAQSLGNQQAVVGYNASIFNGNFNASSLNLTTGYITLPVDGLYFIQIRVRIAMFSSTGTASITSSNPNTLGQKWNSNKSLEAACNFKIGLFDTLNNGIACETQKELTDQGNFVLNTNIIRPFTAGSTVRALFINNSDLPVYGDNPYRSDFEVICYKISEIF